MKKVLFLYRTPRKEIYNQWRAGKGPDSLLFGANHLIRIGYKVDFFDSSYSLLNPFHPLFYLFEHSIINVCGMGFKLDQAVYLYPKFKNCDVIVATGDSAGLPILFLKYLKLIDKPVIYMTSGLAGALKGKTNTWVGKFYKSILPMADIFTSYAQIEIDFFEKVMGLKNRIKYMSLATDYNYFSQKSNVKKRVICAVGTELGRDYKTLFEAVRDLPVDVEVACHPDNIKGLTVPKNVKVHINIPVSEVLKIYQRSLISVVPCQERYRASGQMVLLESASAGLPIVASEIKGLTSAFAFQNAKHLLYTKPRSASDLKQKIVYLLQNKNVSSKLGNSAAQYVKSHYTTKRMATMLASFISNL